MRRLLILFVIVIVVVPVLMSQPTTIRVPQDQPTIQAGINAAAHGDTVLVSDGTFNENLMVNKKIVLASLYMDDGDQAHISNAIIDGSGSAKPDSGATITIGYDTDTTLVIMGFTIRGGKGNRLYDTLSNLYWMGGGGIESTSGGGVRIAHNKITGNHIVTTGTVDSLFGAGIAISSWPTRPVRCYVIIEENEVSGNTVNGVATESAGIGLYFVDGRVEGNIIENNSCVASTLYSSGGGLLVGPGSNVLVSRNLIRGNASSGDGGGFLVFGTNLYPSSATLSNNVVWGNTAPLGAGVRVLAWSSSKLTNNTIAANSGSSGAGLSSGNGSGISVRALNNIFSNTPAATQIVPGASNIAFQNNLIFGQAYGVNTVNASPGFMSGDSLYWLSDTSEAIGKGLASATVGSVLLTAPETDFTGLARPQPNGSSPDLGAIESPLADRNTGVEEATDLPIVFALAQNFPNPFNPATQITYALPITQHVTLKIFDLLGREVAVLVNEEKPAGAYTAMWDASAMPSGAYICRMTAGKFTASKRIVLLK